METVCLSHPASSRLDGAAGPPSYTDKRKLLNGPCLSVAETAKLFLIGPRAKVIPSTSGWLWPTRCHVHPSTAGTQSPLAMPDNPRGCCRSGQGADSTFTCWGMCRGGNWTSSLFHQNNSKWDGGHQGLSPLSPISCPNSYFFPSAPAALCIQGQLVWSICLLIFHYLNLAI